MKHSGNWRALLVATAICLFVGTQGALARSGGSGDHGGIGGHELGNHNEDMKSSDWYHDRNGGDEGGMHAGKIDNRRDADERTKPKSSGKDRTAGKNATTATGPGSKNTIRPIVTNGSAGSTHGGAMGSGKNKRPGTSTAGLPPARGTAGNNTIHPIVTNAPAQPAANPATQAGKLPPNDPVGNTHPTAGANPPAVVTVSNGVTTTQIQNGLGGVSVYSDKPGTITVTNGKESTTLPGGSVTLSGDVVGVGGGQGVEVGPRNAEGNTVVAIKPPAPAPVSPGRVTGGGPEGGFFGDLGSSIEDGVKAVGHGAADGVIAAGKGVYDFTHPGFTATPEQPPPPATSTIQQQ